MEYPNWKRNRMDSYDYSTNGAYFITLCTQNKVPILWHGTMPELTEAGCVALQWLKKLPERFPGILLDSYAIMPDHIHFILFFQNSSHELPQVMKWYKTMTTNELIRNVKEGHAPAFSGHLWQRSYYDHVIRNDIDLAETRRYISENPLKKQL